MDLRLFFLALTGDTVALMSGAGSVVLLVLGLTVFFNKPLPRGIVLLVAAACFFLAAARIWTAEHRARLAAEQRLQVLTDSDLHGEIDTLSVASSPTNPKDSVVTVVATVKNLGAPSIADNFSVTLVFPDKEVVAIPIPPPSGSVNLTAVEGGGLSFNGTTDYLPRNAELQPIATRGATHGFILTVVRGISANEIFSGNARIRLNFKDINGKPYVAERPIGSKTTPLPDIREFGRETKPRN